MTIYNSAIKRGIIHQIFPTPVYIDEIDREFTISEMNTWQELEKTTRPNEGNYITPEDHVLDLPEFMNIKREVENRLQDYLRRVINPVNDIKISLTQSWLNYTHEGEYHHPHIHTNSWLSGVIYLQAGAQDGIWFDKPQGMFDITPKEFNTFNSTSWHIPVRTGVIVIFPSQLSHRVSIKPTPNTRVSLAFNTWIQGELGSKHHKTHLML